MRAAGMRKSCFRLWITLWLICNAECFLIPISVMQSVNTYHNKLLVTVFNAFMFCLVLLGILPHKKSISSIENSIVLFIGVSITTYVTQFLLSSIEPVEGASKAYYSFSLLGYIPLYGYLRKYDDEVEWLVNSVIRIGLVFAVLNWVCYFGLKFGGVYISSVPLYQRVNGEFRLPRSSDFVGLTSIFLLSRSLDKEKTWSTRVGLIICILELLIVARVRMVLLTVFAAVIIGIWNSSRIKSVWSIVGLFIIMGIGVDLLLVEESFILSVLLGEGQRYNSAMHRLVEIEHYAAYFLHDGLVGFGYTGDATILKYSVTDIGILGFIFRYGILGLLWFVYFMTIIIKKWIIAPNTTVRIFIVYILVSCVSLSPFDAQRIVLFPFALIMIDMYSRKKELYESSICNTELQYKA